MKAKWLAAILLLVVVVGGLAVWALRSIPASFGYSFRAKYAELPANDDAFTNWLATRPGVVRTIVNRDENEIRVSFIMTQCAIGPRTPPIPDFDAELERCGYKDRIYWKKE